MASAPPHPTRAILFALAGFALWVMCDTCMKLAGEADLPPYEVVGFLGLVAASSMLLYYAPQGRAKELWPKNPVKQVGRVLMTFGCVMANAVALKHLPLTMFYIAIFASPMVVAILASLLLRERLGWMMIAAIVTGFAGVVIAIAPWSVAAGGDWIGYGAAGLSVLFFGGATIAMRHMTQSESVQSMTFMTGLIEAILGCTPMIWHAVPFSFAVFLFMVGMGVFNVIGNLCNCSALRYTTAATVEQFHYTQIITGALLGYLIWNEVPAEHTLIGAVLIIAAGLYVAITCHKAEKLAAVSVLPELP